MNKDDKMWKCPICDRLISNLAYMTNDGSNICPRCKTSIVYYELFKIDKNDNIYPLIDIEESEKIYHKGYYEGYKEGIKSCRSEESYAVGYHKGYNVGYDNGHDNGQSYHFEDGFRKGLQEGLRRLKIK